MSAVIIALAVTVWLVAAYAVAQILVAEFGIWSLAPPDQRLRLAYALTSTNYPAVTTALGDAAAPHVARFQRGARLFVLGVGLFMMLLGLHIISGRAA